MKFLHIILLCFIVVSLKAQRFDGGVVAGFTASQIDGDELAGFNKGGFLAGFYAETPFSKPLSGMFEIEYYQKGAAVSRNDNLDYGKRVLHYIEFPLSLNYSLHYSGNININTGNKISLDHISLHAGLAPSYFFGGKQEGTVFDNGEVDFYRALDLGWLIGFSYQVNENLSFRIRYTYSLLTISQEKVEGYNYSWIARAVGYNKGDYNNSLQFSFLRRIDW